MFASSLMVFAGNARAMDIDSDDDNGACHLTGSMAVHDDETSWTIGISDLTGEGDDCYARIVIQRVGRADTEVRSFKTHGQGEDTSFTGRRTRAQTTGATLYACIDRGAEGDDCTEVGHLDES
jgi:hypothetical protein